MTNPLESLESEIDAGLKQDGFEVVELHFGPGKFLRASVDLPDGLDIDSCVRAHKLVRHIIYESGLDPGDFRIEVESPGADRPLRTAADYQRFRGERVRVTLKEPRVEDGRRNWSGVLEGGDDASVRVDVDDLGSMTFERSTIESVRLLP